MSAHQHVTMLSGGATSWATGMRVVARHGVVNHWMAFADTLIEHEDVYRALPHMAREIGGRFVRLAEGRTPFQVFRDERFLGNSRVDPCSKILKRQVLDRWLEEHFDPRETTIYVGIDFTEEHRFLRLRDRKAAQGWTYEAPLCEPPFVMKDEIIRQMYEAGIPEIRLYTHGHAHANCGGGCCKMGQKAAALFLEYEPARYRMWEDEENGMRTLLGRDVSMLTDRSGDGKKKPLTLTQLRARITAGRIDQFDYGGCGCFSDDPEDRPEPPAGALII